MSEPFDRVYIGGCYRCKEPMWMVRGTYDTYVRNHQSFFCPHGHKQQFIEGETEEEKLRRENQRLVQNAAYLEDRRREAEREAEHQRNRANGYKGHATRITKRAKVGLCPCCNRSFENLRRHMATKHPEFTPMELDDTGPSLSVIDGGKAVA